ncbi:MAG: hypothetical protein AB8B73_14270 [Ekhidna sp.]
MKGLITGFVCFLFLGFGAFAQSIYSAQGLGSINNQGNPSNFSMGGLGIGTPTQLNINTKNPAFLVVNPFSSFEIGLNFENRGFQGDGISGSSAGGGLNFLAYAFPVMPGKWSSSFGILPFSTVDYDVFSEGSIDGAPNNATFLLDQQGEGGLTNLFWSNGVAINKNLFLGISTQFVFGSIQRVSRVAIFEDDNTLGSEEGDQVAISSDVNLDDTESYRGINLQLGLAYRFFLDESEFFNIGLTFAPENSLDVQFDNLDSTRNTGSDEISLPTSIGFGLSYQKLNVFTIGIDFETQTWKDANSNSTIYQNRNKLVLGGSFTPDYDNVNSYIKRIRYSMGFNYQELPYVVKNEALAEFGINFGASLPVSGYSSFNLGLGVGQLGKSNDELIKETYFKVVIGATINDRWFIKRKYD